MSFKVTNIRHLNINSFDYNKSRVNAIAMALDPEIDISQHAIMHLFHIDVNFYMKQEYKKLVNVNVVLQINVFASV